MVGLRVGMPYGGWGVRCTRGVGGTKASSPEGEVDRRDTGGWGIYCTRGMTGTIASPLEGGMGRSDTGLPILNHSVLHHGSHSSLRHRTRGYLDAYLARLALCHSRVAFADQGLVEAQRPSHTSGKIRLLVVNTKI